jgi:hypothetical protein
MTCKVCHRTGTCHDCLGRGKVSAGAWTNAVDCKKCNKSGKCPARKGRG